MQIQDHALLQTAGAMSRCPACCKGALTGSEERAHTKPGGFQSKIQLRAMQRLKEQRRRVLRQKCISVAAVRCALST
jgi:hypothetical protein